MMTATDLRTILLQALDRLAVPSTADGLSAVVYARLTVQALSDGELSAAYERATAGGPCGADRSPIAPPPSAAAIEVSVAGIEQAIVRPLSGAERAAVARVVLEGARSLRAVADALHDQQPALSTSLCAFLSAATARTRA
jgi:hypothetical protein